MPRLIKPALFISCIVSIGLVLYLFAIPKAKVRGCTEDELSFILQPVTQLECATDSLNNRWYHAYKERTEYKKIRINPSKFPNGLVYEIVSTELSPAVIEFDDNKDKVGYLIGSTVDSVNVLIKGSISVSDLGRGVNLYTNPHQGESFFFRLSQPSKNEVIVKSVGPTPSLKAGESREFLLIFI